MLDTKLVIEIQATNDVGVLEVHKIAYRIAVGRIRDLHKGRIIAAIWIERPGDVGIEWIDQGAFLTERRDVEQFIVVDQVKLQVGTDCQPLLPIQAAPVPQRPGHSDIAGLHYILGRQDYQTIWISRRDTNIKDGRRKNIQGCSACLVTVTASRLEWPDVDVQPIGIFR